MTDSMYGTRTMRVEELVREALSVRVKDVRRIVGVRSATDRKDSLCRLLREVLSVSYIGYVDGGLRYYDGCSWVDCPVGVLKDAVMNALSDMGVGASDLSRMGDTAYSELRRRELVSDRGLVAFSDCVYDVRDGSTAALSADSVAALRVGYGFVPDAPCPIWTGFLEEMLPDAGVRDVLQEFLGMCLVDRSLLSVEKMALFVGSGANGKSVVCDVVRNVLGGAAFVGNLSPDQLQNEKQVSSLEGKVLNIAPDVRKGASFDSALKALASSQEVTGWRLYSGGVTIKCPPLVFALNEMPYFRDTTPAFFRRLLVFRFDVTVPEERQDRTLARRISENESCGVFLWMMRGARRLVANRGMFSTSEVMDSSLKELSEDVKVCQSEVLSALEGMGYAVSGTGKAERVRVEDVAGAMSDFASLGVVTRELKKAGVEMTRSGNERYYKLYRI